MQQSLITPGLFGQNVPADSKRKYFDYCNEQILSMGKIPDILFIGDSITEFWDTQLYFGEMGFIVNRGIAGDDTQYILKRCEADVLQLKPKKIVYKAGINNLMSVAPDLWWRTPGRDKKEVMEETISNIEKFMKKCEGADGYFCSVLPTDMHTWHKDCEINESVIELNEKIVDLCEKYKMTYVDYHSAVCREDGKTLKDGISYDGVHPNSIGYKIMADKLKEKINNKFGG